MNLSRRQFGKITGVTGLTIFIAPSLLLEGCTVNVKALLTALVSSIQAVIRVAEPNAPWLQTVEAALTSLQGAITQWEAGGAVTIITEALNAVEAALAVIPQTAVYAPLVAVIVAGIDAVLAALPQPVALPANRAQNPYRGQVTLNKPHVFQTHEGAYKSQFNQKAKQLGLTQAEI